MEASQYYAVSLGLMIFLFSWCGSYRSNILSSLAVDRFPLRFPWNSVKITWCELVWITIHCVGNVVFLAVESDDWATFSDRAGILSLINAVPLSLGERLSMIPTLMQPNMGQYAVLHRYVGSVVFLEALAHVLTITITRKPTFNTLANVTGLLVSSMFYIQQTC